jgi:hypothetical protein
MLLVLAIVYLKKCRAAGNTNVIVFGLTRPGLEPTSTELEGDNG